MYAGNFSLNAELFRFKVLLKQTKIRSAYKIFYATYKQGLTKQKAEGVTAWANSSKNDGATASVKKFTTSKPIAVYKLIFCNNVEKKHMSAGNLTLVRLLAFCCAKQLPTFHFLSTEIGKWYKMFWVLMLLRFLK